jgi:hypothetical protein
MQRVQYTGTNYEEVKALCGDKVLATSQHGMKTEQIARELEMRGLVPRRAGKPLDGKVIAAIVYKHPEIFCFNEGRVRLLM